MGLFQIIKGLVAPELTTIGQAVQSAAGIGSAPGESLDVFGGDEFGLRAKSAVAKAEPHIGDYVQNAVKNFARNKVGKKIAGKFDMAADVANAFGEDNKTETGGKIQDVADWFAGSDREKREQAKRKRGLYAY